MTPTVLRVAAFAIAVLAVADPAITSMRASRPLVSVVSSPSRDPLADLVARGLDRDFTVVRGPLGAASGTVVVGDALPDEAAAWKAPVFAVVPRSVTPSIQVTALETPAIAPRDSRIPVTIRVVVNGGQGRRVEIRLIAGGLLVGRHEEVIGRDTALVQVTLDHAPPAAGALPLRVVAALDRSDVVAEATTVVDVTSARHRVLFFDPRPSWMSTFVRRAVEEDTRFAVTHRVVTSRGVSSTSGAPPASLRDVRDLASFATVVVGAPEALDDADVAGLESYLRRRGGRVALLMDRRSPGRVDRLTGVRDWRARLLAAPASLSANWDTTSLRAREIAWPAVVPVGAGVTLRTADATGPVLWSIPIGAGRLVVSGALDAWHYRDPGTSGFGAFWTETISELSAGTPRSVDVALSRRSRRPGEATTVRAGVIDIALAQDATRPVSISAMLIGVADSAPVRLWPDAAPGRFTGTLVAPRTPGVYRLAVTSGVDRTEVPFVVDSTAMAPASDDRELVAAFASSRGGEAVSVDDLGTLPSRLAAAFRPVPRVETWHPMRSPWWIIPFALALGAEWWWRRRRGQA